jgi:tyrosinase
LETFVDHSHPPDHHPGHPPAHRPGEPDHPRTFDEVIRRGFPHRHLVALERARRARTRVWPEIPPRPLPRLEAGAVPAVRENQASWSPEKRTAFQNAVVKLVETGKYAELIGHHMDMTHNMHGSMGEVGFYRFLGWHRRYLVEFERELQAADALLRPGAADKLGVPYWHWPDDFPSWMEGFLPARDPMSGQPPPPRKIAAPPEKANAADLDVIVNQFAIQNTGLPGENDYTKFSYGLEGWGLRPNGTGLPAHNHGHAWIGGIMNNTMTSPTDPVFWMHHAEVDRLWEAWRQTHPTPGPLLSGPDRVMDPWAESYDDLLNITALGYGYDSLSL